MDSDLQLHHRHRHLPPINQQHQQQNVLPQHQPQQQQMNPGLMRYRSAPSSYFSDILNSVPGADDGGGDDCAEFLNPGSPETERIFARFMSSGSNLQRSSGNETMQSQFMAPMMHEPEILLHHHHHHQQHQQQQKQQSNVYPSASQIVYQNQSQPSAPNLISAKSMDDSSCVVGRSTAMDNLPPIKMSGGGGSNSNLIRHRSSPAGLFTDIHVESGMLKGPTNFPSVPPSSSGLMARASEIGGKGIGVSNSKKRNFGRDSGGYITGYPVDSWDDSESLSDNYLETFAEDDKSTIQAHEGGNRPPRLSHHLSLPKSSAELSAMEKLLQFQDSVPCKIRAKRGFATHPRSIAERVRRTRISERMRKLQVLVPNMDKQTNTADMLDLAVDYIKDLQTQVKDLSNKRAKCTCSHK